MGTQKTTRRRRRGASLMEMQAAIIILAILSMPALSMGIGLVRESALHNAETTLQWDLDQALWRCSQPIRTAATLSSLSATTLKMTNPKGGACEVYWQNGKLWEKLGTSAPIQIADGVQGFGLAYTRTVNGKTTATNDPAKVTEVVVTLTISRGGFTRMGTTKISMRNRSR